MTQQKKSYLLPIIMMFALFAMISFVTGLPAPFGVIVQSEFGATNLQATLGFAANFIAYFFMRSEERRVGQGCVSSCRRVGWWVTW